MKSVVAVAAPPATRNDVASLPLRSVAPRPSANPWTRLKCAKSDSAAPPSCARLRPSIACPMATASTCARTAAKSSRRGACATSRTSASSEFGHGKESRTSGDVATISGPGIRNTLSSMPWLKRYVSMSHRPWMIPRTGKSSHVPRRRIAISWR